MEPLLRVVSLPSIVRRTATRFACQGLGLWHISCWHKDAEGEREM